MDNLLKKVGYYDLWSTLLPGAVFCECLFSLINIEIVINSINLSSIIPDGLSLLKENIYCPQSVYEIALFVMTAYFMGMIIQEMSKFLYVRIRANERLLVQKNGLFTKEEIKKYKKFFCEIVDKEENICEFSKEENVFLYNSIKFALQESKDINQYVKLNVIHQMSKNISTAFKILGLMILGLILLNGKQMNISGQRLFLVGEIFIVGFILLFCQRAKKFDEYWVKSVVRCYYMKNVRHLE